MRFSRSTAALIVGALGALLAVGYAVTGHAAARSTTSPASAAAQLPLTAYEPTPTQAAQVKYLSERLTQVCMRGFGFAYAPQLSTSSIAESVRIDQEFASRMYGVSDSAAVRTYGYHLPTWTQGSAAPDLVAEMPADERSVFDGTVKTYYGKAVPAGGCHAWAADQIAARGIDASSAWPTGASASALVARIQTDAFGQAQSDPRVLAVFGKWSACMRPHGVDYPSPFAAAGDQRWGGDAPTAQEIDVAEHDIACKSQVNLTSVEFAVVSDYQNAAISRNAATLAPLKARVGDEAAAIADLMVRYRA